jgi:anti-sigma28 factor (negative regulator of flagellin synthesis)
MVNSIHGIGGIPPIKETPESKQVKEKGKVAESPKDQISISSEAKELAQVSKAIPDLFTPLVRQEKINIAKQRINSKFYESKISDVAKEVLKEVFG